MRRLLEGLPRFVPSVLVGAVVAAALTFAFNSLWVGLAVGVSAAVVLLWEETMHPKR